MSPGFLKSSVIADFLRKKGHQLLTEWRSLTLPGRVYKVSLVTIGVSIVVAFAMLWTVTFPMPPTDARPSDAPGWLSAAILCIALVMGLAIFALAAVGVYWLLVIPETRAQDARVRVPVLLAKLLIGAIYGFYLALVAVIIAEVINSQEGVSPLMVVLMLVCALAKGGEQRLTRWIDRQEDLHRRWRPRRFQRGRPRRAK